MKKLSIILRNIFCFLTILSALSLTACKKELACGKCYGKGEIPEKSAVCHRCNGSGTSSTTCSTCKGNKRIKNTASYGSSMRDLVSRPSTIECPSCNGYGQTKSSCSTCQGRGKTVVPKSKCNTCDGKGVVTPVK